MKSKQSSRWIVASFLLTLALATVAAPQKFGTRQLEIPEPRGFVPLSTASPRFMELAQGYLPAGNHLLEVYATPADRDVLAGGGGKDLERYLQLQTLRKVEGQPISTGDFAEASKEMESELAKAFANIGDQASQLMQQGNAASKAKSGVDPQIAASDIGYLGAYRHEPWGMFFSISTKVSAGAAGPQKMICSGALVLIDHQLAYLYAYANFNSAADRTWAQAAVSDWADAIHAANPDDPALEATAEPLRSGFNWHRIIAMGLLGGCVGAVVGVIRRRRGR
jgi:hypothetical protein